MINTIAVIGTVLLVVFEILFFLWWIDRDALHWSGKPLFFRKWRGYR